MFYNVLLELVLALVLHFHSCSRAALGSSPAGCTVDSLLGSSPPDHAGRRNLYWFTGRSVPDRLKVPGIAPGRNENTKEMYDKSETVSKPGRCELEKSEKKIAEI